MRSGSSEKAEFRIIPIDKLIFPSRGIRIRPWEDLDELTESVRDHGVLQPVIVREAGRGRYEVVAGERRARAARRAGISEIPAMVMKMGDEEADLVRMVENIQRRDLSDYEKALWIRRMIERHGLSERKLATLLGKSPAWVSLHLKMLDLKPVFTRVNALIGSKVSAQEVMEKITEGHARQILRVPDEFRDEVAEEVVRSIEEHGEPPPVRELEERVKEYEKMTEEGKKEEKEKVEKPKKETREIDTAVFTCPVCGEKFLVVHVEPDGKHKLRKLREG